MQKIENPAAAAAAHQLIKTMLVYGSLVFVGGFVLGVIRELLLIPMAGRRAGHWIEFPVLLTIVAMVAKFSVLRLHETARRYLLALGIGGTVVLLLLESGFALYVMRVPFEKYLQSFDVSSGELFPFGLLFMVIAPFVVNRYWVKRS